MIYDPASFVIRVWILLSVNYLAAPGDCSGRQPFQWKQQRIVDPSQLDRLDSSGQARTPQRQRLLHLLPSKRNIAVGKCLPDKETAACRAANSEPRDEQSHHHYFTFTHICLVPLPRSDLLWQFQQCPIIINRSRTCDSSHIPQPTPAFKKYPSNF